MGIETIETTVLPVSFGDGSLFVCKPVSSYVVADSLFSSKAPLPNDLIMAASRTSKTSFVNESRNGTANPQSHPAALPLPFGSNSMLRQHSQATGAVFPLPVSLPRPAL